MTAPTGSGGVDVLAALEKYIGERAAAISGLAGEIALNNVTSYEKEQADLAEWHREAVEARATVEAMAEALKASERERADMDEDAPLDPGCVQCTGGATPHDRNTGPCAHHLRVAALARFHGTTPPAGGGDDDLARIGELIRTQDNRITAEPIFIVQQKRGGDGAEPADPWRPINELPNSDDLLWFLSWGPDGGHVVDGPRSPQTGGYDADEWEYFAPCQSPSIRRLASSGGA